MTKDGKRTQKGGRFILGIHRPTLLVGKRGIASSRRPSHDADDAGGDGVMTSKRKLIGVEAYLKSLARSLAGCEKSQNKGGAEWCRAEIKRIEDRRNQESTP